FLRADGAGYEHMLAEPVAALIHSLAGAYDAIVAPATTTGKNVMPRVAALLDVMQVSDIVKVIGPDTFERLIYAGNAVQTVRSKDKTKVITVRTSTFQATGAGGASRAWSDVLHGLGGVVRAAAATDSPRLNDSRPGGRATTTGDNYNN